MPSHDLQAVVEREGDVYVARCYDVGTASHGYTVEEAISNLREVTWQYLEAHPAWPATNTPDPQRGQTKT